MKSRTDRGELRVTPGRTHEGLPKAVHGGEEMEKFAGQKGGFREVRSGKRVPPMQFSIGSPLPDKTRAAKKRENC